MNFQMVLSLILFALSATFFVGRLSVTQSRQYQSDQQSLQRYNEQYQSKVGSTILVGDGKNPVSYNLKSFDGGQSWWSLEYDDNDKIITFKPADPELVEHHDAMIELGNYAREHGPINGSDSAGIEILEAAGFTVERLPNE